MNGTDQVLTVRCGRNRFAVDIDGFPIKFIKVQLTDGPVDCVTDQQLFRAGTGCVAPFGRTATDGRQKDEKTCQDHSPGGLTPHHRRPETGIIVLWKNFHLETSIHIGIAEQAYHWYKYFGGL